MRNKLILIPLVPITIFFFMFCREYEEPDRISNLPFSVTPEFIRFTEPSLKNHSPQALPTSDYNNLINIDFKFETLPHVCENEHPFLLILVHSAPRNYEKRRSIRETWGRASRKTRLVFLLGSVDSDENQTTKNIKEEHSTFNDLVIGSFTDTYKNLTYKHTMGFKYAIYHCSQATYILKTDDDVFVNIPGLLRYIYTKVSPYGAEKLLMCNVWHKANVARSYRSRYRFSFKQYQYRTFPTYCSGWFILYSPDVVLDLYTLAQNAKYFWIDDVFITGILAEKSRIPHFNIKNIVISQKKLDEISSGACDSLGEEFLLGRPNIHSDVVRRLWTCSTLNNEYVLV